MAEEDMIFGKNRHFFGGIEPSNMLKFEIAAVADGISVAYELPLDTVVNGQRLCTVGGAVIRRTVSDYPRDEFDGVKVADVKTNGSFVDPVDPTGSYFYKAFPYTTKGVYNRNPANMASINTPEPMVEFNLTSSASKVKIVATLADTSVGAVIRKSISGYPKNENDGEEVMTITESGTYTDTDVVVGETYYYSAFPYTSSGGYNRDITNRASVLIMSYGYLFGYDIDLDDSDPDARVSYPSDVDNFGYDTAYMDFTAGAFNYGSWPSVAGELFMPKPCMLNFNGTVNYYLNQNNYSLKEDGSASDIANTSYEANAMMEWPKIYTKRWEENGVYHFRCCDIKLDDDYDCWCNYDKNNNEIDHFYTAIYPSKFAYLSQFDCFKSVSGQNPETNQSFTSFRNYTKTCGDDWDIETLADRLLIQDLLVMMAKTTDCQTAYGYGCVTASKSMASGTMDSNGLFWGQNSYSVGVKVFGMEHWWGNVHRIINGWHKNSSDVQYVKITRGNHDGSTATDYNGDGTGYISMGSLPSAESYINEMTTMPYGRIPKSASNGSATTYECDAIEYTKSSAKVAAVGGSYGTSYDQYAGPFYVRFNLESTAYGAEYGAAISCKPSAT